MPSSPQLSGSGQLRVLYICYFPVTEPLVETQVISYLSGLAQAGHAVHLLSYETDRPSAEERVRRAERLRALGISWHGLTYHKRPRVPATAFDIVRGVLAGARLMRVHRLDTLHARVHVPGAIALLLRRLTGARLIFDLRGLMAEEYEEAGSWRRDSAPFRMVKWVEEQCLRQAAGIVVLTERLRQQRFSPDDNRVHVIPCCADIEGIAAQRDAGHRLRRELGLLDQVVLVYSGKATGIYMVEEMVEFFACAREEFAHLHFLILTQSDPGAFTREFTRRALPHESYTVTRATPDRIGSYLAAADVGISFRRAGPSQIAASPTKIMEYWAAGLPVVCNPGIGDIDHQVREHRSGVLVGEFSADGYRRAAHELRVLLADRELRERVRRLALETASLRTVGIPRYERLYRFVANSGGSHGRGAPGDASEGRPTVSRGREALHR